MRSKRIAISKFAKNAWQIHRVAELFPISTIEDAQKSLAVVVTEQDIKNGKRGDPAQCAVAQAAMRMPGLVGGVINKTFSYLVHDNGHAVRYKTPASTYARIIAFDLGGRIEPGVYPLSSVGPAQRLGRQSGYAHRTAKKLSTREHEKEHKQARRESDVEFTKSAIRVWGNAMRPVK